MLGEPVEKLLPDRFRGAHVDHRPTYLAEPRTRSMGAGLTLFGRRKDGAEFPVDISLSPLETEEGTLLAAAIRDVTERKRLESLRIEAVARDCHVEIAISDDGTGVPAELVPHLFEPFTRGKTAGATGGSGIGLALCHELVHAFGGSIWYETAAHPYGARFVVQLRGAP